MRLRSYNKKEQKITGLKHQYLIFIDEVGDPFVHFDLEKIQESFFFSRNDGDCPDIISNRLQKYFNDGN